MKAVPSTFHQCVKFLTPSRIFTLRGNQRMTRSCFLQERKIRTASSFMIIELPNQSSHPSEEPEPIPGNEITRPNAARHASNAREEDPPISPRKTNTESAWKSDLRLNMSIKKPKKLLDLFEMEQLENEPLRSYLDRFKNTLPDLDEIPGASQNSEAVLVQSLGNGLRYRSRFQEDFYLHPFSTLKDAFLRAEQYVRLEQDIPQRRFESKDLRLQLGNKRRSSSRHLDGSTPKAPGCHRKSSSRRDDMYISEDDTERNMKDHALANRHTSPQCAFSDQEIFKIIADIQKIPLTNRLSEVPQKKRVSLHLSFYDGRDDPKQWISSFMIAIKRQRYASPEEQSAHFCQAPGQLHRQLRRSGSRFSKATPPLRTRRPRLSQIRRR
ncbi:unnamed protein product [Microthlaspi erraticum]|uniref:Retrotransposon gag domain-containing protein n=1 Tax=Microthlaspi erraticum TaxID=1685480 RepID=A0A6D2HTG7_9BRAS|nr:unnamed protein product [Microthlaspi erraticum]